MKNNQLLDVFCHRKNQRKKILRIMRITTFLLLVCVFCAFAENSHSQNTKVTINKEKVPLEEVLLDIEKQTDYLFVYNNGVNVSQRVSINAQKKNVSSVLAELFSGTEISYEIEGKHIVICKAEKTNAPIVPQQVSKKQITGTILDSRGEPIIGANVIEKSAASNGTITDIDGHFTLNVNKNATLLVSYIGYNSQTITISGNDIVNIRLTEDTQALEEIVVVGYGTQKKQNLVGAVAAIKGEELGTAAAFDVTNAISGRLPGAFVMQGSGEPGKDEAKILIRGRSTLGDKNNINPLVVIDGIPDRSLYEIDPNDIESMSVLKDASAAIYGSRAANGVILVTTKSGSNKKASLNYQFNYGIKSPTILPKTADAGEYSQYISDYQSYEGLSRLYSDRDIELYKSGIDPWEHPNTDWMGDLVKSSTAEQHHSISINGGHEKMRYYTSFGYKENQAIYRQESAKYKQYNFRVKLDMPITDWLETSVQYGGFITNRKYPTTNTDQLFGWATMVVPTSPSFWPTGEPGPDFEAGVNPVVNTSFDAGYDQTENSKHEMTARFSIKPPMVHGLSIDGFFNYDISNSNKKRFKQPWTLYFPKYETAIRNPEGYITSMELEPRLRGLDSPELTEQTDRTRKTMFNFSASYGRTFGDHTFSIFGAYEQQKEDFLDFEAYRKYFISDLVQALDAGGEKDKTNSGRMTIYARKSLIARLNYSYKDKYLMEFIFRRDGSIKFHPSHRWGNFPAVLLAWRASEETFWKENISFIDYFKLRGTYGNMGMDPGDPFQYINKYALASGVTLGTNKDVVTKIYQSVLANPNITWEKQRTINVGFDSQFYNQMFHLNAELFFNRRSDILVKKNGSVPSFTGLALPDENIGIVDNKGFELDAGFRKKFGELTVDLSGNVSWARNKVVFMDEPNRSVEWQRQTGHPYGTNLVYNALGLFKTQQQLDSYPHWSGAKLGDIIFEDYNSDKVINADDRIMMDKTDGPELFYGMKFDFAYKNWSLSILAQGQGSYYKSTIYGNRGVGMNVFKWVATDYWTPENSNSDIARPFHRADQYWSYQSNNSTYWYDNMAYLRLKNVTLNYNLPKNILSKVGVSNANLFLSGYNLCLLYSAQKNYDPEVADPQGYPAMKTFSLGVNLTF